MRNSLKRQKCVILRLYNTVNIGSVFWQPLRRDAMQCDAALCFDFELSSPFVFTPLFGYFIIGSFQFELIFYAPESFIV